MRIIRWLVDEEMLVEAGAMAAFAAAVTMVAGITLFGGAM